MIEIQTYQPGTFVQVKGIPGETHDLWVILVVTVELRGSEHPLKSHEIGQTLTMLAVDANGDELREGPDAGTITINSDMYDIKEL